MEEKYYLIVLGLFERDPIVYEDYPSEEEIAKAIVELKGKTARVEKRYVLTNNE